MSMRKSDERAKILIANQAKTRPARRVILEKLLQHYFWVFSLFSLCLVLALAFMLIPASAAQDAAAPIRMVQAFEAGENGFSSPAGLAFSPKANAFLVLPGPGDGRTTAGTGMVTLTLFARRTREKRIAAQISDPINTAFDNAHDRLLILQFPANQMIEIKARQNGDLDEAALVRHDVGHFGLGDPQGMSVDPDSGEVYILDRSGPRILRVSPESGGGFEQATISVVDLGSSELGDARGLAFDPATGHLHLASPAQQSLYELDPNGRVVARRDLSAFGLGDPQGMVFAPSGDQTDDPQRLSLYLADSGAPVPTVQTPRTPESDLLHSRSTATTTDTGSNGQIVEFSLLAPASPAAAAAYASSLINTVDLAAVSPPSPDPSGLAYITASNHLVMDDGEVEEKITGITHFEGANVWELSLAGGVVATANLSTVPPDQLGMTNEPTGVTWNPNNGHYFITDDNATQVYDLDPGNDGQIGTSDDSWTSFDTLGAGSGDPEGITFDSWNNRLFVADGVNQEVYQFTLTGSLVGHFDVAAYGVVDPESVAFNPFTGTLFIMGSEKDAGFAAETDTGGNLLQTIDLSAAEPRTAAGLVLAPASNGSGAWRFYIVDRGVDNNFNPNLVDGKLYEMTAPASTGPGNNAPAAGNDAYSTDEDVPLSVPAPGVLGNDNDADGNTLVPILVSGVAHGNLVLHPNGSFTYTPDENFNGSDSFTYKANDSAANSNTATVTITVNSVNDAPKADADGPYTGTIGLPVHFDASDSSDVDGTITSYAWDFGDGNTGSGPDPTHIYTTIDTYTVVLTVTDNNGATGTDETTANIKDAPNQAPTASNNGYASNEDAALSVSAPGVLANDNDPDGDPISAVLAGNVTNGGLSLYPDGAFVYIPAADFYGTDSFSYRAYDGEDYSSTATVTLTVNPVNDPPTAEANGPYGGTAGVPVQFDAAGSGDIDGTIVTYSWDFGDGNSANGPAPAHIYNTGGTHTVTLMVTDDGGATGSATTSATIQAAPNQAPTAGDDAYSSDEDVTLNVAAPGVLANDNDPDGNALTALLVTNATHGDLTLLPDGSFTYAPDAGFSGSDTFFYRADDGAAHSGTATVTLTIDPVNGTPQVAITSPSDGATFAPGAAITFTGTASDSEDGDLSADITWASSVHGTLGTGSSYAAILSNGTHTITANVTDSGGASGTDQIVIMVGAPMKNFLPIIVAPANSLKSARQSGFNFGRRFRPAP